MILVTVPAIREEAVAWWQVMVSPLAEADPVTATGPSATGWVRGAHDALVALGETPAGSALLALLVLLPGILAVAGIATEVAARSGPGPSAGPAAGILEASVWFLAAVAGLLPDLIDVDPLLDLDRLLLLAATGVAARAAGGGRLPVPLAACCLVLAAVAPLAPLALLILVPAAAMVVAAMVRDRPLRPGRTTGLIVISVTIVIGLGRLRSVDDPVGAMAFALREDPTYRTRAPDGRRILPALAVLLVMTLTGRRRTDPVTARPPGTLVLGWVSLTWVAGRNHLFLWAQLGLTLALMARLELGRLRGPVWAVLAVLGWVVLMPVTRRPLPALESDPLAGALESACRRGPVLVFGREAATFLRRAPMSLVPLHPATRPFPDPSGRRRLQALEGGTGDAVGFLDREGVTGVLVRTDHPIARLLRDHPGWTERSGPGNRSLYARRSREDPGSRLPVTMSGEGVVLAGVAGAAPDTAFREALTSGRTWVALWIAHQQAIRDPRDVEAMFRVAEALLAMNRVTEAKQVLGRLLRLPDRSRIQIRVEEVLTRHARRIGGGR